jgi:putative membrane protein
MVYFIWSGKLSKRILDGGPLPSSRTLRLFNELPVFVMLAIVYLVVAKPF